MAKTCKSVSLKSVALHAGIQARFALLRYSPEDLEFGWSEWSASLTAVLSQRRNVIPNSEVLIFSPHLATNPLAYLCRFGEAASVVCRPDGDACPGFWLVAARGMLLAYPERMIAAFSGKGAEATLHDALVETKLDYVVLELSNIDGEIVLTRVHLTPPSHAPTELLLMLVRMFGIVP